jgi:hypothetical protein
MIDLALSLVLGLLALTFDRKIANAMNCFAIGVDEALPQLRWPTALPPRSRESFENCLWFVRFWGAWVVLFSVSIGLSVLLAR